MTTSVVCSSVVCISACMCMCVLVLVCACANKHFFQGSRWAVEVLKLKMKSQEDGSLFQDALRQGERMGVKNFEF